MKITILALCALLVSQTAFGQIAGRVKAAHFPGWVERSGDIIAIKPGLMVEEGDFIYTGEGGKLLLSMDDGSDIKLGNSSQLEIKIVKPAEAQNNNVFGLALNVLKGVFRFTTSALGQNKKRDVAISFGTVTAGIRGTDIWGRVNEETDLVCLLEGKIDVSHPQSQTIRLDQPRQYYDAAKGDAGALKGKVDVEQLTKWARLTELDSSYGIMSEHGQWSVVLMSLKDEQYAQAFSERLNQQGYPSEIVSSEVNNETYHRVIIKQFKRYTDAISAQKRLMILNGVRSPWIKKYSF